MQWLTWTFVAVLAAQMIVRLWLASRQIAAVRAHRDRVPAVFRGQIALPDYQKAADYTVARVRLGRWAAVFEMLFKLVLTIGGGLAAMSAAIHRVNLGEPWAGALVLLAVFFLLEFLGLPFALWRTFRIETRFGFNRT